VRSFLLVLSVIRNSESRSFIKTVLEDAGHRVIESSGFAQTQSLLSNGLNPDLLLLEYSPATSQDADHLERLLKGFPKHRVCLIVGIGEQGAVRAGSALGIRRFLPRPITRQNLEAVAGEINQPSGAEFPAKTPVFEPALAVSRTSAPAKMKEVLHLEELGQDRFFLAASPKMLSIYRQVKLLADVDVNVLILGESGTGKEVVAHLIHKHSRRAAHKFLKVNCAALPADLLESELFGHQQGAFTGATKDRTGKFEQANRGTLLLDEIGEMTPQMQAKLLHVLQDGQFTRLGGQGPTKVDVRVLAATNIQMESALQEKTFREDLYYRLNAFMITVPPLRERREEIPYLIEETIRRMPLEMKNGRESIFSTELIEAALQYEWRGNIRELRNFVIRTVVLRDPASALRELAAKIGVPAATGVRASAQLPPRKGMRSIVRDVKERTEMQMIKDALDASAWNRRKAAQSLHISYRTLLYKIQQHGLSPNSQEGSDEDFRDAFSA